MTHGITQLRTTPAADGPAAEERTTEEPAADERAAGEQRRLAAVHRYQILDTPPEGVFDRVAALAARICDTPMASVAIVDSDRVWFKAVHGLDGLDQVPRAPGLCASAVLADSPYAVADALADPRTAAHPLVDGDPAVRFYAAAPLITAQGERLGTVNVLDTRPREATEDQLASLKDLASLVMEQLELRLAASQTVTAERQLRTAAERLTRTLQRTLLPPVLPTVPGLEAVAAYRPASVDEVGGDFYDLFPLADGRWAFFLGDVCGKGADAAALTSLTRYTLRAAAIYDPDPCAALANLDTVLKHEYQDDRPRYCTAIFGVLQPAQGGPERDGHGGGGFVVTLAGGGHPPALALRADGAVEPVPTRGGQLVGILPDPRFTRTTIRLLPGDALLLYTDGLTEAREADGGRLGEDGLAHRLASATRQGAHGLVALVDRLLTDLGAGVNDDTALLALSVPPPRSATAAAAAAGAATAAGAAATAATAAGAAVAVSALHAIPAAPAQENR